MAPPPIPFPDRESIHKAADPYGIHVVPAVLGTPAHKDVTHKPRSFELGYDILADATHMVSAARGNRCMWYTHKTRIVDLAFRGL